MRARAAWITRRTGVSFRPMMRAQVMTAPSQWKKWSSSPPETPGKRYLAPPENPTTSWGKTGPSTSTRSWSSTARLTSTGTRSRSRPSESAATSSSSSQPTRTRVSGRSQRWQRKRELPKAARSDGAIP